MTQQSVLIEDERTRKINSLSVLSIGIIVTMGGSEILTLVLWLINPDYPVVPLTVILVAGVLIGFISYWLVRIGKEKPAGYFFVISLLVESSVITPLLGGFVGPMAITFLFSILVAGIVININAAFFTATVASILYLGTVGIEKANLLPQLLTEGAIPYLTVAIRLVFFYLLAFLSWFAASRLNQALHKARLYASELQAANEKLRASEEELRASNEELEAANEELRATEEELRASNEELEAANQELKEAQEQLVRSEKLAAIGQLAGGVGHELRNPLGAIKNAVYYIRGKVAKSELAQNEPHVMEFLEIMDDEINSSNKIINDLLSFSRVGKSSVSPARAEKVIDDAISHIVIPENIELDKRINSGLPQIEVDSDQIRQVLVNMLTNAVQAMPEGGKLSINASEKDGFLELAIADTGVGIPREIIGRIFDPLYTTKPKGIGLGLAVCKSIIDRHQGRVEVESALGKGTTFTIKLPINMG